MPLDNISLYFFLKELGNGFLKSNFANTILIQSEHSFLNLSKNLIIICLIMRELNDLFGDIQNKKRNPKSKDITLLHAATHKVNSFRPYVYESSNSFIILN